MGINLGMDNIGRHFEVINEVDRHISELMYRWKNIAEKISIQRESATALLIKAGWPPPLHFPVSGMGALLGLFERGEFKNDDLSKVFIEYYTSEQLDNMLSEWCAKQYLSSRTPLLREAVENYKYRKFASCVAVILPNIEGIIGDYLEKKPNPKNNLKHLFDNSGLDKATTDFYANVVLVSFNWSKDPILGLSRNQILHGKDTTYGTPVNALKTILLFDAVQRAIDDKWKQQNRPM